MKILDLIKYDPEKGQFVLKGKPLPPLSPFRWREDPRPSIFAQDSFFRAKQATGTIKSEEGLGYKQFGTFTRAKERQPNKHEGVLEDAQTKAARAIDRKTGTDVR